VRTSNDLIHAALAAHVAIPGWNVPYLPMIPPVVAAIRDTNSFGLISVARVDWMKFEAASVRSVFDEYQKHKDLRHTRLHVDHVPVIDEDGQRVLDCEYVLAEAADLGYDSIMIDGSRLPLEDNIAVTRRIVEVAHKTNVAVEAELGAVMGHEPGPLPPYDQLFASGKGFTNPDEARRFVAETGLDWLSIAIGSVHGAISAGLKDQKKVQAKLNIDHLKRIRVATPVPLVLHGGTGIPKHYIQAAIKEGIAKINVAMAIRQPYEQTRAQSVIQAQDAVYETTVRLIREELEVEGLATLINQP
jgi:ketose-bisphosphate aldolase